MPAMPTNAVNQVRGRARVRVRAGVKG